MRAGGEEQLLIYLPLFRRSHGAALRKAVKESRSVIIYSWQPEIVRQQLHAEPNVEVQAVPENLARRFGIEV